MIGELNNLSGSNNLEFRGNHYHFPSLTRLPGTLLRPFVLSMSNQY